MNDFNNHPLELAAKLILLKNDGIRDFVSNVSKINTLTHAGQLCNQIGIYQRIASFASCCCSSYERSKIIEQCNHEANDCYNELGRLMRESLKDETVERYANMRREHRY
ncbi:MAG: hypothetical protein IJA95_12205 [Bacteroidaceae bacterium]|nr:hypothetical protein [Bacteroides sp.]MBQ4590034.1 hypothetical protein [Bacteroidaceae bacterium]